MQRPKPGKTFTQDEILKMAEDALTKTIARPKLGAWAIMQLVRESLGLAIENTPARADAVAKKPAAKPAQKRTATKRTASDAGGV